MPGSFGLSDMGVSTRQTASSFPPLEWNFEARLRAKLFINHGVDIDNKLTIRTIAE